MREDGVYQILEGTPDELEIHGQNESPNASVPGLVIKTRAERFSNYYRGPGVRETEVISYDFKP